MIARALYSKTRINVAICNIIYSLIALASIVALDVLLIKLIFDFFNDNNTGPVILISIIVFVLLMLTGLLIAAISANAGIIIKHKRIINYYKNIKLTNIKRIKLNYDSKLWLTAAKNTFHPQSFTLDSKEYKTAIIFTNSSSYYGFPRFRMPDVLLAKNYINYYAEIGYDEVAKEFVIIRYTKSLND